MSSAEESVWESISPSDIWVMDKLILSKKLGYNCGPVGMPVPSPGMYIVRPCVNMMGLGLGTSLVYLENDTTHLPVGYFWCEKFEGRHYSIDYYNHYPILCVEGIRQPDTFVRWDKWIRRSVFFPLPSLLKQSFNNYEWINCEFIGSKLIEVHLRNNEDFQWNNDEFIPVWEGESIIPPEGYKYVEYPDVHRRIGAFIK